MTAERMFDPSLETIRAIAGVPIIEAKYSPRGSILHVARGAFIDSSSPALVVHPIDAQIMAVAVERDQPMKDPSVHIEGFHRYLDAWLAKRLRIAMRRIAHPTRTEIREQYESSDSGV